MSYMDLVPERPNGHTAVLLHGKNFCGPYWHETGRWLQAAGWRVIVPDQIGFCKSDKPTAYQYSFHQLASNTNALLRSLDVVKSTVIAHSTGGIIGARYALLYPDQTEQLVMIDPLTLEDVAAEGIPWRSVDDWYQQERNLTYDSLKKSQLTSYYHGEWKPPYDQPVQLQVGMYQGAARDTVAMVSALIYDAIYTQPVVYALPQIRVPTTLIIGDADRAAIGKGTAPPPVAARVGNFPALARAAVTSIQGAKLIELPGIGHAPMLEDPAQFQRALASTLSLS